MTSKLTKRPGKTDAARIPMLIGGEWRVGQAEFEDVDPCRREAVARAPEATLTTQRGIMVTPLPALLRSRGGHESDGNEPVH